MVKQRVTGRAGYSNDEFKAIARRKFGDRYNYDKVEYVNRRSMVTIICPVRPVKIFGGEESFKDTLRRDAIKVKLAARKGLSLYRPTYRSLKEDRLERYLKRILTEMGHVFDRCEKNE